MFETITAVQIVAAKKCFLLILLKLSRLSGLEIRGSGIFEDHKSASS